MRISGWSPDVCSSVLDRPRRRVAACERFITQAEQVRRRTVEIKRAAVEDLAFEQAGVPPLRELRVGQVRDLLAHARFDFAFVEGEVEQDAAHALALTGVGALLRGRQAGLRERVGDTGFSGLRSEERRVGKEGVSTCRYRRSPTR